MPSPLIIANWKMNPVTSRDALGMAQKTEEVLVGLGSRARNVGVVIAPPFPFLGDVGRVIKKARIGAQDVFWRDGGPFTGEVSWQQLKALGVRHVIVGHSERRIHMGETDAMVNQKVLMLLQHAMMPILCIGEKEREGNEIPEVVGEQLKKALEGVGVAEVKNLVVAYEPVWAISTSRVSRGPDTPDNALRAILYIRKIIANRYGPAVAHRVRVIYGGSVNARNVGAFLKEGKIEGALVGGASLDPEEFGEIIARAAGIGVNV